MPNWRDLGEEIQKARQDANLIFDTIRKRELVRLHKLTGRNVILYYSGWLQKADLPVSPRAFMIHDGDKNGFMATLHTMDFSKGLDLILHTPGGEIGATESLVDYLRVKFKNIRVIVPQIAMSAGTMIACASNSILMGDHSSLGPIDPQINGLPAHGILAEFKQAVSDISQSPASIPVWQPIIAKYHPTLIGECQKAIDMSEEIVGRWLKENMFAKDKSAARKCKKILAELGDHDMTKSHSRHISKSKAIEIGLKVESLEADDHLQDAVMTIHHACIHTLAATSALKIIENHKGISYVDRAIQH